MRDARALPMHRTGEALSTLTFWLDEVRKQTEACAMQLRATPAGTAKAAAARRQAD